MLKDELKGLENRKNKNITEAYSNIFYHKDEKKTSPMGNILKFFGMTPNVRDADDADGIENARLFGLSFRKVNLSGKWYENGVLPMIVLKNDEPKTVVPDIFGRYCIIENDKKTRLKSNEGISDEAYVFYRNFPEEKIGKSDLIRFMLGSVRVGEYAVLFILMLLFTLIGALIPRVQYYIFNNLIPAGSTADPRPAGYLLLGVILVLLSVDIFKRTAAVNIPHIINAHIQGAVISRMLMLDTDFFREEKSGKISAGIIGITDVSNTLSENSIGGFFSFILCLVYFSQIRVFTPYLIGYVLLAFAVVIVFTVLKFISLKRYEKELYEKTDEMSGFVYEVMGGMENIKLNNSADVMFNRWSRFYANCLKSLDKPFFYKYHDAFYTAAMSLIMLLVYYVGNNSDVPAASFIAFINLYALFIASVGGIGDILTAAARYNASYNRARDFFMADIESDTSKIAINKVNDEISFEDVSFKYKDAEQYAVQNISFKIKKGKKIGITGKSGCGKSTLLRLLLGFEHPTEGCIFIDNKDVNEVDIRSFRKRIGVVMQNSGLIPSSRYSNITLTAPDATTEEINDTLEAVGLKDDIDKMPLGLNTFVSNDNLTISGGQKQRILLARAMLTKPDLLIFDEATNSLDNITQASITQRVLFSDVTALIVAHRISTVRDCDTIIFLQDGRIAESGSYSELMSKKGGFYNMFREQTDEGC